VQLFNLQTDCQLAPLICSFVCLLSMRYASGLKVRRFSFALLLPLAELAAWTEIVAAPTALTVYRLHQAARGSDRIGVHFGQFQITLPRRRWLPWALESVSMERWRAITAANLPGTAIETLISLLTSWPSLWHPSGLSSEAWRTVAYPFFCLPAWWFVGLGLDGLLRRRRLHWATLLTGSILCLLFLVPIFGFRFGLSAAERVGMGWVFFGFGFWTVAFGILPIAWIRQK
jgi:hypothetical protein